MLESKFFKSPPARAYGQKVLVLIRCSPIANGYSRKSFSSRTVQLQDALEAKRMEALKKYGLLDLNITWPKPSPGAVDYIENNPKSTQQMYGEADLSQLPIFPAVPEGFFINFGYWTKRHGEKITIQERLESSKEMYRVIGDFAEILENYNILEVGCGLGYGGSLISERYRPKMVIGIDISPEQIARAKKHQIAGIKSGRLRFTLGEAETMPFPEKTFDTIISVEAAQHFQDMDAFSREAKRILKPGGTLVVTSFFPTKKEGVEALNDIVPNYPIHGSQNTVAEIKEKFSKHMANVEVSSIGGNVWDGFSKWLAQIGYQNQWSNIWSALYKRGLLDYVVFKATAPTPTPKPIQESQESVEVQPAFGSLSA